MIFVTCQEKILSYSFTLTQYCSNNIVEYQTLRLGLELAVDRTQLQLHVFGDSDLVIYQLLGSYEVKSKNWASMMTMHKNSVDGLEM